MFSDYDFSNLRIYSVNKAKVYIVDSHQYVLPIWAYISVSNNAQYSLVTFDFHADTKPAFNRYACLQKKGEAHRVWNEFRKSYIKSIDPTDINVILDITENLVNDEHISAAVELGYIHNACAIVVECESNEPNISHFCAENFFQIAPLELSENPYDREYQGLMTFRLNRIEDDYISHTGFTIPSDPFILDFDLDYFPTRESLNPPKRKIVAELISKAQAITVAREEFYFKENCEQQGFGMQEAEHLLLKLIEGTLKESDKKR